jgi:hypothetical protein
LGERRLDVVRDVAMFSGKNTMQLPDSRPSVPANSRMDWQPLRGCG